MPVSVTERGRPSPPAAPPLRAVFPLLAAHRATLVQALLWSLLFVIVPMQVPLLTGDLVTGITGHGALFFGLVPISDPGTVLAVSVAGLVLTAGAYGATAYLSTASVSELSRRTVADLRKSIVRHLAHSSIDVHDRFGPGELLNRIIVDTQSMREFVERVFFNTIQNVLRVAWPVAILFLLNPEIALIAAAFLPVQYVITRRLQARLREATRVARTTQGQLTASVKEHLDGIETIQTSSAEAVAVGRLWRDSDRLATDQIAAKVYGGLITGSTWAITSLGLALTWWLGGSAVLAGTMTLGTLVAITGFVVLLYTPMQRFTLVLNVYQRGLVAFERIREVLDSPSSIVDDPRAPNLTIDGGRIEFRHVSFAYASRPVLRDVSLDLAPRGITVVLGRNGSGKSTLLKLLSRLHDPAAGSVRIDHQDLRQVRLASLRAQVAVVPQRPVLFAGTVEENLRLGRPGATEGELWEACRDAGVLDLVARLPEGLASRVGPGRGNVSGGEAQRIAIARALLRRPKILLLDEPNSALDPEAEARLVATLERLKGRLTVLVVAHHSDRILDAADQVVVMEQGRVVPSGLGPAGPAAAATAREARRERPQVPSGVPA